MGWGFYEGEKNGNKVRNFSFGKKLFRLKLRKYLIWQLIGL
jgi:hypothetical protein